MVRIRFLRVSVARLCHDLDKHEHLTRLIGSLHYTAFAKQPHAMYHNFVHCHIRYALCQFSPAEPTDFYVLKWPGLSLIQYQANVLKVY